MSTNTKAPAKEKNKLGSLVKAFRPYYAPFIVSIVLLITSVIFTILTPGTIRSLTNEISPVGKTAVNGNFVIDFEQVTYYALLLVFYVGTAFITGFISGFILNTIIQKFSKDIRRQISCKINKMPLNYFDTTQTGDILSVITNDVDILSTSLQNSVSMLVQSSSSVLPSSSLCRCLTKTSSSSVKSTRPLKKTIPVSSSSRRSMPRARRWRNSERRTTCSAPFCIAPRLSVR